MQSLLWQDYETGGTNARRDRPTQFAGVRTDLDHKIIGQPTVLYCKPSPDILPSAMACLITGISPLACLQKGLPEYQFAAQVNRLLSESGTIRTGYNTIAFDDEVTRHLLWRNLIDPYASEWQNGCGRWDTIGMMRACYAFRPEGINWPVREEGKPSFRLSDLSAANGIAHDAAHDALSDVYATIGMARLVHTVHPDLYDFCFSLRRKENVAAEIGFPANKVFVHVDRAYGADRGYIAMLTPISIHPTNDKEIICWDLSKNPDQLADLSAEAIRELVFSKKEDLPEGVERPGLHTVATNKAPIVMQTLEELTPDIVAKWNINMEGARANYKALREIAKTRQVDVLVQDVYNRKFDPCDPEEDLYGGFVSKNDRRTLNMVVDLPEAKLANLQVSFDDCRLDTLLFRYKARNFPSTLNEEEKVLWDEHMRARLIDGVDGHRTIGQVREEIAELRPAADAKSIRVLDELGQYVDSIAVSLTTSPGSAAKPVVARKRVTP